MSDALHRALEWHIAQQPPTCLTLMPSSWSWFGPDGDLVLVKHNGTPAGILTALLEPETKHPRRTKRELRGVKR